MDRDFYKVLLVGASGKGKTYSFRNMDPETTGFINVENKPLPFKNSFKYHKRTTSYTEVYATLVEYARNPEIKCIAVDSFSAFSDLVLKEMRATKKGFDIWSGYNEEVAKFNDIVKKINKEIFVTAHYEILALEGAAEKRVKVAAKQWEGVFEKDYTMVLYAENKFNDAPKPEYYFSLCGEGISAKCPPDIFGEDVVKVQSDSKVVLDSILKFVNN